MGDDNEVLRVIDVQDAALVEELSHCADRVQEHEDIGNEEERLWNINDLSEREARKRTCEMRRRALRHQPQMLPPPSPPAEGSWTGAVSRTNKRAHSSHLSTAGIAAGSSRISESRRRSSDSESSS